MDYKRFVEEVLMVIALLLGLTILNIAMVGFAPFIIPGKWLSEFFSYCSWIGRLIFAIIIFMLIGHDRRTRIPISLLSAMAPYFGALFYLFVSTIKKTDK
ncbi:MAG TPA: hypothetical protein VIU13_13430 [Chryseolinea sp.]